MTMLPHFRTRKWRSQEVKFLPLLHSWGGSLHAWVISTLFLSSSPWSLTFHWLQCSPCWSSTPAVFILPRSFLHVFPCWPFSEVGCCNSLKNACWLYTSTLEHMLGHLKSLLFAYVLFFHQVRVHISLICVAGIVHGTCIFWVELLL